MTAPLMVRSQAVMTRLDSEDQENERGVTFVLAYEDTGAIYRTLILSFEDWQSMGSPEEITMGVEPGAMLNVEVSVSVPE